MIMKIDAIVREEKYEDVKNALIFKKYIEFRVKKCQYIIIKSP